MIFIQCQYKISFVLILDKICWIYKNKTFSFNIELCVYQPKLYKASGLLVHWSVQYLRL